MELWKIGWIKNPKGCLPIKSLPEVIKSLPEVIKSLPDVDCARFLVKIGLFWGFVLVVWGSRLNKLDCLGLLVIDVYGH